jgi:hypothetical protein
VKFVKILKGRQAVATSNDKEKMPKCGFCNENKRNMLYTEDRKLVCYECANKDGKMEFVDKV